MGGSVFLHLISSYIIWDICDHIKIIFWWKKLINHFICCAPFHTWLHPNITMLPLFPPTNTDTVGKGKPKFPDLRSHYERWAGCLVSMSMKVFRNVKQNFAKKLELKYLSYLLNWSYFPKVELHWGTRIYSP